MFRFRKQKLKLIRKGWHKWHAWYPVGTLGEKGFAWLRTVERKYYQKNGRHVVKKGLNESRLSSNSLQVMYRPLGSDAEKKVYVTGRTMWRDPKEIVRDISKSEWNRIQRQLDTLESRSLSKKYLQSDAAKPWEVEYIQNRR